MKSPNEKLYVHDVETLVGMGNDDHAHYWQRIVIVNVPG